MSKTQENNMLNEIKQVNKEINLLQDRLKKNEKSLNQFQNGLLQIKKRTKDGSFSNQRNTKYSQEYIEKQNKANRKEY